MLSYMQTKKPKALLFLSNVRRNKIILQKIYFNDICISLVKFSSSNSRFLKCAVVNARDLHIITEGPTLENSAYRSRIVNTSKGGGTSVTVAYLYLISSKMEQI
jgi:hypothetical protein